MAQLSASTFSMAGGAVDSLFGALGAEASASQRARGLNLNAASLRLKAKGDLAEASEYDLAGDLAKKNIAFTQQATVIKEMQADRQSFLAIGGQKADVAGAGFASSGSALDLLADSAREGALTKNVLGQQGLITEAGFQQQADSYALMSSTARSTAEGEFGIADKTDQLARETEEAGRTQAMGGYIGAALKAAGAVASVVLAPATGGLSLAALPALASGG